MAARASPTIPAVPANCSGRVTAADGGSSLAGNTCPDCATFVSSTRTPAETVYQVVRAVFENFDQFRKLHPAFRNLKASEMIKDALSAPLHDGAMKYYKEKGWM